MKTLPYRAKRTRTHQVLVQLIESEAGWGQKVDEERWYRTVRTAQAHIKRFNSHNTAKTTPSWYMYARLAEPQLT